MKEQRFRMSWMRVIPWLALAIYLGLAGSQALQARSSGAMADYWVLETVDSDDAGLYNSIAVDSSNYPHISYYHSADSALRYAYKNGSGWFTETVDNSGTMGYYTSIEIDTANYPHISYYDDGADNLRYAYKDGSGWFSETVESSGAIGLRTSLALDGSDFPHISYMHSSSTNRLNYAYKDGGGWHPEIVDTTSMDYSSIDVDGNGYPHIAYRITSPSPQAKYAYKDGGGWHFEIIDGTTGSVGEGISLVLDPTTPYTPHVSYYDRASGTIEYAYRSGSSWITETVDNVGCLNTSIALDGNGYPHVSYCRYVNSYTRDLRYAYRNASGWITKMVTSGGNQGSDSGIAVDGGGRPHISYIDGDNSDLEYAYVMTAPPPTDRYVDHNGTCNSLTPCYTTIGAAVAASYPGDAIYVFPGTYAESVDLSTMIVPSDISFVTVDATGAPSPGTVTVDPAAAGGPNTGPAFSHSTSPFLGNLTINGFNVTSPDDDGIDVIVNSAVVIANVTANGSADDGVDVIAQTGSITVTNSSASNNGGTDGNGFYLEAVVGNVTVISSTANSNTGSDNNDGFEIWAGGDVEITSSSADQNSEEGIDVEYVGGNLTISNCSTDDNGGEGLDIDDIDGNVFVSACTSTGNGSDGVEAGETKVGGDMTITSSTFNGNSSDGIDLAVDGDLTLINCTANNNRGTGDNDGIEIGPVDGTTVISNCTVLGNSDSGFDIWDTTGPVTIAASVIRDNDHSGVWLDSSMTSAAVHGSVICGNGAGIWPNIAVNVDAEGNWWGDTSGPTHPSNVGGSGDTVVDGSNGGSGTVDFGPWIDTISGSAAPTAPGNPSLVQFQFSGGDGSVFLGLGPGDLYGTPPFTLTTDNGTLSSAGGTAALLTGFVNNPNGVLSMILTPAITGTATVTLDGPCNLDGVIIVPTWEPTDWLYLPLVVR
ncbi:MAG: hypothetical protein GY832_08080 [Chloroflexi bacterium]|nr:hypothetical protein [Chloroflexota bacterium]